LVGVGSGANLVWGGDEANFIESKFGRGRQRGKFGTKQIWSVSEQINRGQSKFGRGRQRD
jgi:hypothetical protein